MTQVRHLTAVAAAAAAARAHELTPTGVVVLHDRDGALQCVAVSGEEDGAAEGDLGFVALALYHDVSADMSTNIKHTATL